MAEQRVLIIESDESFAKSLSSVFSEYQDIHVKVVGDGKEGLREAKEGSPKLILLSVELPKLSGYSICKKLKSDKQLKSIPLVIMSSEATEETFERHRKLKTRADEYLIKPFENKVLLEKISGLIDLETQEVKDSDLIMIEDEESIVIDDLPDLDDDDMGLLEEDATVVKDGSLESSGIDDLEEFDDVLEDLEVPDELASDELRLDELGSKDLELSEDDGIVGDDDELEGFNDVLESLKEVEDIENVDDEIGVLDSDHESENEVAASGLGQVDSSQDVLSDESPDEANLDSIAETVEASSMDDDLLDGSYLDEDEESLLEPDLDVLATGESAPVTIPSTRSSDEQTLDQPKDPFLSNKLKEIEEENQVLRQKLSQLEQKLGDTHRTYEKRESELGSLRTQSTSKDKEFLVLKATINSKDREILELKEECTRKDQELLDIREKTTESEQELYRIRELVKSHDQEMKEQSEKVATLLRQKSNLEDMYQTKMAEWEEQYNSETAKLEHQMQIMGEEHQKALFDLQQKNHSSQQELREIQQRHDEETTGMKSQIEQLDSEIQSLRDKSNNYQTLEEELETAKADIMGMEEEKTNYEQKVLKAYQKIKNDEMIKEKAKKAVEIALTLLADQVSLDDVEDQGEELSQPDSDEVHTE